MNLKEVTILRMQPLFVWKGLQEAGLSCQRLIELRWDSPLIMSRSDFDSFMIIVCWIRVLGEGKGTSVGSGYLL